MLFSAGTAYALRALAALPADGTFILARNLAAQAEVPAPYLAKVLKTLARKGVLDSARGRNGGYRLARAKDTLTVGELVLMLNDLDEDACVMGRTDCERHDADCPLDSAWKLARLGLDATMAKVTVRAFAEMHPDKFKVIPRVRCGEE
jgi:Rrf2 family protein